VLLVVVAFPSCPYQLTPQQYVGPAVVTPHVCSPNPTERVVNVSAGAAATGASRLVVDPSPSCPYPLRPQHQALPNSVKPQVTLPPAERLAKVSPPTTGTGEDRFAEDEPFPVVPSPSRPSQLAPQQYATAGAALLRPQSWSGPATMLRKVMPPEIGCGEVASTYPPLFPT